MIFLTYFLKDCTKKVLKIYKPIVIENLKPVALCRGGSRDFEKGGCALCRPPWLVGEEISGFSDGLKKPKQR